MKKEGIFFIENLDQETIQQRLKNLKTPTKRDICHEYKTRGTCSHEFKYNQPCPYGHNITEV